MTKEKGFTIIELLVVVAIISLLAGIVLTNVTNISARAKVARANAEVTNLAKALILFNAQYGDYPWGYTGDPTYTYFFSAAVGGTGDPYLNVGGVDHYLSEIYKLDWDGFNAGFLVPEASYYVNMWDEDADGRIGCGVVEIYDSSWNWYGYKYIICEDCPYYCEGENYYPFRTTWY